MVRWCVLISILEQHNIKLELCEQSKDPPSCGDFNFDKNRIRLFPESDKHNLQTYTLLHELSHYYTSHTIFKLDVRKWMNSDKEFYGVLSEYTCCLYIPTIVKMLGIYLEEHEQEHNNYILNKYRLILDKKFKEHNKEFIL